MTTAVSARVRRSVRYSRFEIRNENRVRNGSLQRERITVSDQMQAESFPNVQDWTGRMGVSPSGRFQVIEDVRPKKKLISREGIRWDFASALLIAVAGLIAALLLAELASIGASSVQIRKLEEKIEAVQKMNEGLQAELAVTAGDISVCTEAVKLNMISSNGAKTILLEAPSEASMLLVQTSAGTDTELRASAPSGQSAN